MLQSPVSSPQASPKVEASGRPKQDQHLSISRKVQNGNTRDHPGLSDSRGMGVVYRPLRLLPSHPHPRILQGIPMVLPWFSSVAVYLPPFQPSHGIASFYNDCKGSEADDPHKWSQTSPIPGQLAYQGLVPGGDTNKYSDRGRPNTVLRVDNQSREVRCFHLCATNTTLIQLLSNPLKRDG